MYDVVALGELLIDFAAQGLGEDGYPIMAAHPGGAPANCLAALAACGKKAALLGKVGQDMFGEKLIGTLRQAGIGTEGIVKGDDVFTTLAFVSFDENGDRSFAFARKPGADTALRPEEVDLSLIEQARVFHFGSLSLTDEPARSATQKAVEYAKQAGKAITFDPNFRPPLWGSQEHARQQMLWGLEQADVVKISDDEVSFLFGCPPQEGAARIRQHFGTKLVLVTMGAKGCWYENPKASGHVPAFRMDTIDTTGAGDIFGGTAIAQLLDEACPPQELEAEALERIVRYASAAAGISTTRSGGISSVPTRSEVEAFLAQVQQ